MQNRYTGDIGDFGKLGLLRILQDAGLSIGVNWYLTPDETHTGDGRHVKYLANEEYRSCDEKLWLALKDIVNSGKREIQSLQNDHILNASFFSEALDFSGKLKPIRNELRNSWHNKALDKLSGVDVVFVDPDNGLIVPSAAGTARENKYVLPNEIIDYYQQGSSVIYYQHKARRHDSYHVDLQNKLIASSEMEGASSLALKFKTTSYRFYFFIIQPRHEEKIANAVRDMMASEWSRHFTLL